MLPEGWVRTTLGEIAAPSRSRALPSDVPDLPYVGLEHIESQTMKLLGHGYARDVRSSSMQFSKGDLLYGRMRPYLNKVWVAEFDGICSAEFLVFQKNDDTDNEFLALRLNAEDFVKFANEQVSGERPRVQFEKLAAFPILLPPAREQKRIVGKLSPVLLRIQRAYIAAQRAQERLQRYRRAVLLAAVSGDLTLDLRQPRNEAETSGFLLETLLARRRELWEEEESQRLADTSKKPKDEKWKSRYPEPKPVESTSLPKVPQGWIWASLDQVLWTLKNGISEAPKADRGLAILRISAVRPMKVDLNDRRYLPSSTVNKYQDYILTEGDLLFTRYNGTRDLAGVCGRVPATQEPVVHPDKLIRGVPIPIDIELSAYLEIAMNTWESRRYIETHLFTTAGQWGISGRNLRPTPVPLPPPAELENVVKEVRRRMLAADRLAMTLEKHLVESYALRRSLLNDAFTGALVPQDSNEESADILLERIRHRRSIELENMNSTRLNKLARKRPRTRRPVIEILRTKKGSISTEQLFRETGYEASFMESDAPQEVVDDFYKELQTLARRGKLDEQRDRKHQVRLRLKE